jgi:hypothetical protein
VVSPPTGSAAATTATSALCRAFHEGAFYQVQRSAAMSGHPRALVCGILNEDTSHELTCSHVGQMSARDTYSVSALARYS